MQRHCLSDEISFDPLKKDLLGYSWSTFCQDAWSAISVSLLTAPQAMAYALLAGLPLVCGLFAVIYSAIIAALFGSSRHLIVGPSNAIAILVQTGTAGILYTYYRDLPPGDREIVAVQILTQLALLAGLFQVFAAACKLGRLTQFVSYSVIVGYITGAAITVAVNQSFVLFGIDRMPGVHTLYERGVYLLTHFHELQWTTSAIGITSLILLLVLKRFYKQAPAAAITFAFTGLVIYLLEISPYGSLFPHVQLISDTGEIYSIFPIISFPFFNMGIMNGVLPVAFAIALLSVMETTSVAKSIAASSGQRLSVNQEILGIGLGNLVSAFVGALPVSGSPSRSGLNYRSGGQTRFAAVLNGIFVILMLYSLGFFISQIPLAATAAFLLVTAASLINMQHMFICLKATRSDALVLWVTLLSCIFFSLDIAFYAGIMISIISYLKKSAIPQLVEYSWDTSGELKNLDHGACHERRQIRLIKVEGELFFGAADIFQRTLKTVTENDTSTRVIILQLKNARDIDATACLALLQLNEYLRGSGRYLVACGLTVQIWEVLSDSGIVDQLGKENLFIFDEKHPQLHMQKAFQWANELVSKYQENEQVKEEGEKILDLSSPAPVSN